MKNRIFSILFSVLLTALFISCPAAPPTEPMDSYLPYVVPSTVEGLTASNGYENEIRLSWNASSNATGYQVWMIDANNYGASSGTSSSSHSYSKLEQRGFTFYEQVSSTSCDIKNLGKGKAYIFSVVALRDLGDDVTSINNRLLYSDISDFVEGSTVGNISLSAVPTTKSIILYWDVPNIFSAIPSVPGAEEPLYDHEFTIKYREKGTNDWLVVESDEIGDVFSYPMSISEYSLSLNTTYEFQVSMAVELEGEPISSVDSDILPVVTDSSFSIEPVLSVDVEQGVSIDSIAVSWKAPSIPTGIDSKNVFKIERAVDDGSDPSSLEWTTLISPADFDALSIEASGGVYSWKDDTASDNTKYYYRITNGYKQAEGVYIMQDSSDPVTISSSSGWKIWRPDMAEVAFSKDDGGDFGTLSFSWKYPYEASERISWVIEESVWRGDDGKTETRPVDGLSITWNGDSKEYVSGPYKIEAEEGVVKVYSYKLNFMVDGKSVSVLNIVSDDNIALGSSSGPVLISNISATTDYVEIVKLSWTVDASISSLDSSSYTIYEDEEIKDIEGLEISGDGLEKSISLPAAVGVHSYRIAVTVTESGAQNIYYCPDIATGSVLNVPEAPSATDGTDKDGITVTWTVPVEHVVYELCYKAESAGDSEWTILEDDDNDGSVYLPKAGDSSDGQIFEFKLRAYNKNQSTAEGNLYTDYSSIEHGNVFGAGAMTVSASYGDDPEAITISWAPALGADYYEIYRDGVKLPGQHKGTSYSDSSVSKLSPDESNPIPLSKEYAYTVVPVSNSLGSVDISYCKTAAGKLFAPPEGINASKGGYVGRINISWDEVDGASYYMLQKYKLSDSGEYIAVGDPIRVNGTSYDDTVSTESVYYSVQAVNSNGVASQYQNGFSAEKNMYGEIEYSNYGYRLSKPQTFFVSEQVDGNGVYKEYVQLTWSRSLGADTYRISALNSTTEINVTEGMVYGSEAQLVTNGKSENEIGYLSYDPATGVYTYNDATGVFTTSSMITSFAVAAKNSTTDNVSENASDNTPVHRQFTDVEYVNLVNHTLYGLLHRADESSVINGDWFQFGAFADEMVSYSESNATVSVPRYGWAGHKTGLVSLTGFYDDSVKVRLTTSDLVTDNDGGFAEGDDPLNYLRDGTITVDTSLLEDSSSGKKYKSNVSVKFGNINVISINSSESYTVTIDGAVTTINDSASLQRPF